MLTEKILEKYDHEYLEEKKSKIRPIHVKRLQNLQVKGSWALELKLDNEINFNYNFDSYYYNKFVIIGKNVNSDCVQSSLKETLLKLGDIKYLDLTKNLRKRDRKHLLKSALIFIHPLNSKEFMKTHSKQINRLKLGIIVHDFVNSPKLPNNELGKKPLITKNKVLKLKIGSDKESYSEIIDRINKLSYELNSSNNIISMKLKRAQYKPIEIPCTKEEN